MVVVALEYAMNGLIVSIASLQIWEVGLLIHTVLTELMSTVTTALVTADGQQKMYRARTLEYRNETQPGIGGLSEHRVLTELTLA